MSKKTNPTLYGLILVVALATAAYQRCAGKDDSSVVKAQNTETTSEIQKSSSVTKIEEATDDGSKTKGSAQGSSSITDDPLTFAMPVTPSGVPEQILRNDAYVSSFNSTTLIPNWVAWRLTSTMTEGPAKRSDAGFSPDERVEEKYRVTTHDYVQSGYDRGHMCPAADNKFSIAAMQQCFLMTNMCPQDHGLNIGDWNEMENQCRRWANEYGEIYVVCGPILYKGAHKRIGKEHKVTVPEAFFKVVLCMKGEPWVAGFIYKNEGGDRPKGDYQNTLDQVERITGLKFFPTMPEKTRKALVNKTL